MTRSFQPVRALFVTASALLIVAAAGCGTAPTAPIEAGSGSAYTPADVPPILQVKADGSVGWVAMPVALQSGYLEPGGDARTFDPKRALTSTAKVDGAVGGRIVCGRYVLSVPPGAFAGTGTITMSLPDSTLMLCDLDIAPASLNGFALPLDLTLHTSETAAELDSLEIYWWDPSASKWTSMGCQKSTLLERVLTKELISTDAAEGVRLELDHFSRYETGKAGW